MQKKQLFILINLFLLIISPAHGEVFSPTLLQLSAPEIVSYAFDGSEIEIPVTVSGTPASVVFLLFTQNKASTINNVRNGHLGWHYVNKIDTCIYVSADYHFSPGNHVVTWGGRDADGNPVAPGAYTYYMWAYDNVSGKKPTAPLQVSWDDASTFKTHNADEIPLDNPILFSSVFALNNNYTQISRKKWIIGNDPADTGAIETCSYMGWAEHAPLVPDPNSDDMFFIMTIDDSLTAHLMKYSWVPNGDGQLQTAWGIDGEVIWKVNTESGDWRVYSSAIYAGSDVLIGTNTDISGFSNESELILIDAVQGYETKRIDLSDWWIREQDGDAGGQQSGGPSDFDFRNGLLFMGSFNTCLNQVINPFDEDWNRWVNQNGDYVGDRNFEETSDRPWVCHDIKTGPYKYQFTVDDNLFSIFPAYDQVNAFSFGLYAPDGTGIGYYAYAGETIEAKRASRFVDYGSAYDGIYTDNYTGGSNTWHFIGHDSIKGTIVSFDSYLCLLSPNGGEIWGVGSVHDIIWNSYGDVGQISIEYSINSGSSWDTIIENIDASIGKYEWIIPDTESVKCLLRITDMSDPNINGTSDNVFTILHPFVQVITPNGGERWAEGTTHDIKWEYFGVETVQIEYSTDNAESWIMITNSRDASSGFYSWEIPDKESTDCFIKITGTGITECTGTNDNVFTISIPFITVKSPNGGEEWKVLTSHSITWESDGVERVNIYYSMDSGESWNPIVEQYNVSLGSYSWSPANILTTLCMIKIDDALYPEITDQSDDTFSLVGSALIKDKNPLTFSVNQNTPNPFNPTTSITFSLPEQGNVIIDIFNIKGQRIDTLVNGYLDTGIHTVYWDGSGFSAGLYLYNVKYGSFSKTMKMLLLR